MVGFRKNLSPDVYAQVRYSLKLWFRVVWAFYWRPRCVPSAWDQTILLAKTLTWVHYHSLQPTVVRFWPFDTDSYPARRHLAQRSVINVRWTVCSETLRPAPTNIVLLNRQIAAYPALNCWQTDLRVIWWDVNGQLLFLPSFNHLP